MSKRRALTLMLPQADSAASPAELPWLDVSTATVGNFRPSWYVPEETWAGFSEQAFSQETPLMIVDRLEEAGQYCRLHPGFDAAFDLLRSTPFDEVKPGRHEVMGDALVMIVDHVDSKGRDSARLEAHRKYIDVQYIIPGKGAVAEEFGWRPTAACSDVTSAFDKQKDIAFFGDKPELWFTLPPGHFVVFFPGDAHAPLAGQGKIRKAVIKVAVDW